jgi:hypothetical protein
VAATGPAGAAGPVTTCGAGVASGVAVCATGGGESNTGGWTGALSPVAGVVGGAGGSAGAIGAGGTAPVGAENGAPASSTLSKLCINSPGVRPWAGAVGVSGAPVKGDTPVDGSGPVPGEETPVIGIEAPWPPNASTGGDAASGGGAGACAGGMPPDWVKLIGEPVGAVGCRDGGCAAGTTPVLVKASGPGGGGA